MSGESAYGRFVGYVHLGGKGSLPRLPNLFNVKLGIGPGNEARKRFSMRLFFNLQHIVANG